MMRRVGVLVVLMLFGAGALFPCGGGAAYDVSAPLVNLPDLANRILYPTDYFETFPREEVRFLYALRLADSTRSAARDSALTRTWGGTDTVPSDVEVVPMAAFDAAIAANDLAAAEAAARTVVRQLFEAPTAIASPGASQLRRAVELLDLAPVIRAAPGASIAAVLASTGAEVRRLGPSDYIAYAKAHPASPRIASVRARALRQRVAERIPNGWVDDIRKAVPAAAFDSLQAEYAAWLHDYPSHPLVPFVRAARVRLWYFADDRAAAWRELLSLYAIAPERVVFEMRYLLYNGCAPPDGILTDASVPPVLRAALVGNLSPTRAEWSALWAMGQQQAKAPWRENLEERLLAATALDSAWETGGLPREFPAYRATASELWRALWALSQLRAGHPELALQVAVPPAQDSTGDIGLLLARAHLQRREWTKAATVATLDSAARNFLVQALAPDSALVSLRAATPTAAVAAQTQAARHAWAGDWRAAAADLAGTDAPRAALFTQAAALAADTSAAGHLAFARWLVAQNRKLFRAFQDPVIWYRSLGWRWQRVSDDTYGGDSPRIPTDLPWTDEEEAAAIDRHLRNTTEHMYALREYRAFFERTAGGHPQRRAAVREANTAYRAMMDYGHAGGYWEWVLPSSPEAQAIREAGRAK